MKLSRSEWAEIALFSLAASALAWLIYHGYARKKAVGYQPTEVPPAEASTTSPAAISPLNFGLPSLGSSNSSGCGCNSCAAGSTTTPTIQAIIDQTNAAIAQMQAMGNAALVQEAAYGNQASDGWVDFTVS